MRLIDMLKNIIQDIFPEGLEDILSHGLSIGWLNKKELGFALRLAQQAETQLHPLGGSIYTLMFVKDVILSTDLTELLTLLCINTSVRIMTLVTSEPNLILLIGFLDLDLEIQPSKPENISSEQPNKKMAPGAVNSYESDKYGNEWGRYK